MNRPFQSRNAQGSSREAPYSSELLGASLNCEFSPQDVPKNFYRHVGCITDRIKSQTADLSRDWSGPSSREETDGHKINRASAPIRLTAGESLFAVNIEGREIEGAVRGVNFSGAYFGAGVDFRRANLDGADISNRFGYKNVIKGLPPFVSDANLSNSEVTLDGATKLSNCRLENSRIRIQRGDVDSEFDLSTVSIVGSSLDVEAPVVLPNDLSQCSLAVVKGVEIDIRGRVVAGVDLSGILEGRVRTDALPDMGDLRSTSFWRVGFPGLDLSESQMTGASLKSCDLRWVKLPRDLQGVVISDCDLREDALVDKNLNGAALQGVPLEQLPVDLTNVTLIGLDLRGVDLSGHKLNGLTLVKCQTDGRTILPVELENVTFRNHQGSVPENDYGRIRWEFTDPVFAFEFPPDVKTDVMIGAGSDTAVSMLNLDLSSYDMSGWKLHGVLLRGCTLPSEVKNVTFNNVLFERCKMPEFIAGSRLSDLSFRSSDVSGTTFEQNSYGGSVREISSPPEVWGDPAAKRFFHLAKVKEEDLSELIPQLAPEFGKTYSLFWPRTSSPRHTHELHIRRASEDEWIVLKRDDEVKLAGVFVQEVFTFNPQGRLEPVDGASQSNKRNFSGFSSSDDVLRFGVVKDLESILCARQFAGNRGPFIRITDDESGKHKTHFFCAEGLPFDWDPR